MPVVRALTTLILLSLASACLAQQSDPQHATQLVASGPGGLPIGSAEPQPTRPLAPREDISRLIESGRPTPGVAAQPQRRVVQTTHQEAVQPPAEQKAQGTPSAPAQANNPRRLAPRSQGPEEPTGAPRKFQFDLSSLAGNATTTGAALALVVGLLLLTLSIFKKAAPRSQRVLPSEVAGVIGRIPLSGKQVAHLLKVGNKLVLVCVSPDGVEPLTEVTDPAEVTRLLGMCEQNGEHSASTAFRDVFDKLAKEPAKDGFLGGESQLVDRQQLAAAYANTPGGRSGD